MDKNARIMGEVLSQLFSNMKIPENKAKDSTKDQHQPSSTTKKVVKNEGR